MQSFLDLKYNFLRPLKFQNLKRYGKKGDGGYICDSNIIKNTNILISFGMGPDWSFELDCINENSKVQIHMYDHTVSSKPYIRDVLKYFRRFITFRTKISSLIDRLKYLKNYLSFFKIKNVKFFAEKITNLIETQRDANIDKVFTRIDSINSTKEKSVILKCDIEGSEFIIINDIVKYSDRIDALIVEFHSLDQNEEIFLTSIKKLQNFFTIAHIHGNNHCGKTKTGLPIMFEITLINNKYIPEKKEFIYSFPVEKLDSPNNPTKKDISFNFQT